MEKDNKIGVEEVKEKKDSEQTIKNHVIGAMAVGLIPLPVVDLVALIGVQINMLRKLTDMYNIPFSQEKVKNILASLIGGGLPITFSSILSSIFKAIPIVGYTTSAITMPILAGASTYAVGKVFVKHFESGGTFLNFNAELFKNYYDKMFKEGQEVASNLKKNQEQDLNK